MAFRFYNRVAVYTATTGTNDVVFGSAISDDFITPVEAGAEDDQRATYVLEDGSNWEIGLGTIADSGTSLTRDVVYLSSVTGVIGDDMIALSGVDVVCRLTPSAEAMNDMAANAGYLAKAGYVEYNADHTFAVGDGAGKWHTFNSATDKVATLPLLSETLEDVFRFRNIGTGAVVITPQGIDQIENASTFTLPAGWSVEVSVNGDRSMWRATLQGTNSILGLLRFDAAQTLTAAEKTQALVNLGLSGARDPYRNRLRNSAAAFSILGTYSNFYNPAGVAGTSEIVDGWVLAYNTSAGAFTFGRTLSTTANGSPYRIRVECTTADTSIAAGEYLHLYQKLSGREIADLKFGLATASKVLAKFQVKLPSGTWAVALRNAALNRSIVKTFTISGAEINTETAKTVSLDGDVTGTWVRDFADALYFSITLMAGSTYQHASNGAWAAGNYLGHSTLSNFMASNTNVFEIGDLQFCADPSGSGVAPTWQSDPDVLSVLRVKRFSPHADVQAGGRLTLTSATPVTSADVTGAGAIYYTPYQNNQLGLYVGNGWVNFTFVDTAVSISLSASKPFDIWGYVDSNGLVSFDSTVWTSATARDTALAYQDGILVKSGDATRRYLGTVYCDASTQFNDSYALRHVWNYHNRVDRPMRVLEATSTWTYTNSAYRQARGSSANQISYVVGVPEDLIFANIMAAFSNTSAVLAGVAIGLDSTTTPLANSLRDWATNVAGGAQIVGASAMYISPIGKHDLVWLEWSTATGTSTWQGSNNGAQSGIFGKVRG